MILSGSGHHYEIPMLLYCELVRAAPHRMLQSILLCNCKGLLACAGIAGLQAAVDAPSKVRGVQLLDVSLRMLHTTKQQPWQRPLVSGFQRLLRETQLGQWFFSAVAKPQVTSMCNRPLHARGVVSCIAIDCLVLGYLPPRSRI